MVVIHVWLLLMQSHPYLCVVHYHIVNNLVSFFIHQCSFQTDDFFVYVFNFAAGGPINYHLVSHNFYTKNFIDFCIETSWDFH